MGVEMRNVKVAILCMASFLLVALPAFGLDLEPGNYEITSKVEMSGMPGGVPPQTITQCLTENNPVPDGSSSAQGCKITEKDIKGNTVTYTMECEQQGMKMKSTGKMVYKGKSFEGTNTIKMGPEAGGMTVTTKITGNWIGKCDK